MPRTHSRLFRSVFAGALVFTALLAVAQTDRIRLTLDSSEAEAVLAILDKQAAKQTVTDTDWQRLFSSEPYTRLKKREASLKRTFTDDDFKKFVTSPELAARRDELQRTLTKWKQADLQSSARRVLSYLPQNAVIRAKVYPVIKPVTNSFVFETKTDPAIFLYLDPAISSAKFENTVAHELHHIGIASVGDAADEATKGLPENVRKAADWMSAFGEGEAMLAAAGGPDVDPQATSTPEDRARWQKDMENFNPDLLEVQKFFDNVIAGNFRSPDELQEAAFKFFGVQGPWYTVGYRMAVMVEKRYGRAALVECMLDPRKLLRRYNMAARAWNLSHPNDKLELWSADLLTKVSAPPLPDEPAPDLPRSMAVVPR
jgi:putative zinc-dependent peptidase DUF5700